MHFEVKIVGVVSQDAKVDEVHVVVDYTVEETVEILRQYPAIVNQIASLITNLKGA